jgi:hypothetical protein
MTAEEIARRVGDIIQTLKDVHIESIKDSPTKAVLFDLCLAAFRLTGSPRLTAQNLRVLLEDRWSQHEDLNRRRGFEEVCGLWEEWWYALERSR